MPSFFDPTFFDPTHTTLVRFVRPALSLLLQVRDGLFSDDAGMCKPPPLPPSQ